MEKVHGTHRMDKAVVGQIKEMAVKERRSFNSMLEIVAIAGIKSLTKKAK